MGGISYNVWLGGLCVLGSTTDGMTPRHTGHLTTHYMIYQPFDLYFKYSGTSVHELNPFLEVVREPKCS
jgi:hypothetical protein